MLERKEETAETRELLGTPKITHKDIAGLDTMVSMGRYRKKLTQNLMDLGERLDAEPKESEHINVPEEAPSAPGTPCK